MVSGVIKLSSCSSDSLTGKIRSTWTNCGRNVSTMVFNFSAPPRLFSSASTASLHRISCDIRCSKEMTLLASGCWPWLSGCPLQPITLGVSPMAVAISAGKASKPRNEKATARGWLTSPQAAVRHRIRGSPAWLGFASYSPARRRSVWPGYRPGPLPLSSYPDARSTVPG